MSAAGAGLFREAYEVEVCAPETVGCVDCGWTFHPREAIWRQCQSCGKTVAKCKHCAGKRVADTDRLLAQSIRWHFEYACKARKVEAIFQEMVTPVPEQRRSPKSTAYPRPRRRLGA